MDICKCHSRRALYQSAVCVFIILLQFNFEDFLNLSLLCSLRETIKLSSSNSIIIMRDKKNPGVHSHAAYLILVDLLSHTDSHRTFWVLLVLQVKNTPSTKPSLTSSKRRKIPSMPRLVWDITREINHRNALCCTQRRSEKPPRATTT